MSLAWTFVLLSVAVSGAGAVTCPAGQYGTTSCTACAAGTFLPYAGATSSSACNQCASGMYCTAAGASLPGICPANSYCPTPSTKTSCGAGLKGPSGRTSECAASYPLWGAVGFNGAVKAFTGTGIGSSLSSYEAADLDITPDGGFLVSIVASKKQLNVGSVAYSAFPGIVAGQASCSTLADAVNGASACFLSACAVAVSADGTFALVADSNKLRRMDLSGTYSVTTVAGSGSASWGTGEGLAANLGGLNKLCVLRDGSAVVLGSTSAGLMVMSLTSFSVTSLSPTILTRYMSLLVGANQMIIYTTSSGYQTLLSYPSMSTLTNVYGQPWFYCRFYGVTSLLVCTDQYNNQLRFGSAGSDPYSYSSVGSGMYTFTGLATWQCGFPGYGITNSYTCAQCGSGSYSIGAGVCSACPAGSYGAGAGSSVCSACAVGQFSTGTGMQSSGTCVTCNPGRYSTGSGVSACAYCSAGTYYTGTGVSVCTQCAAGSYSTGVWQYQASACVTCSAGAYSTGVGQPLASTCVKCSAGSYYTGVGTSACLNCAAGAYSTGTGFTLASTCVNCAAGAYYTGTGGSTCASCAAGAYYTGTGLTLASGCALCAVGTFSPTVGLGTATCQSCGACGAGGFKSSDCASGATANTMVCQCSAGFYGDGTTCAGCKTCHANAASVSSCPVNSATDTSVCACNAGYYGNGLVCAGCKTCHANATSVSSCPVNSVVDTSACACNAGHYGNGLACAVCPVNAYCGAGVSEPQTCPTHTLSSAGSSSQLDCLCEAGFFCQHTKALNAVMTLNCTAEDFANDVNGVRTRLILAIAAASNVPPSQVHIQGYVPHVRSFHRGTSVRGLKVSVTVLGATHINFVQYGSTRVLAMRWHEAHRVQVDARAI